MIELITTVVISLATGVAGGFSGWFFGRKRQSIENIDLALGTWQKVVDSLEKRVDVLLRRVEELQEENARLKEEIARLRDERILASRKDRRIEQLEKKIERYEKILCDHNIKH